MSGHTPGPWTYLPNAHGVQGCEVRGRSHEMIADIYDAGDGSARLANAILIAAAPELLAALKALMSDIDTGVLVRDIRADWRNDWATEMMKFVQRLQAAQSAIAKAEGRT